MEIGQDAEDNMHVASEPHEFYKGHDLDTCEWKRVTDCPICNEYFRVNGMTRVERRSVEQSGLDGATRIFMAMQPALMKHVETVVAKARGNGRIGEVLELIHDLAEALNLNAESVNVKCKPVERFIWEENNGRHDEAYSLDERLAGLLDSLLSVFICVKRGGSVDGVFKTFNVYSYLLFVTLLLILRIKQSGNTARAVLINPPPDISPTVVLLIVAFILAPRAPQFCPKVA